MAAIVPAAFVLRVMNVPPQAGSVTGRHDKTRCALPESMTGLRPPLKWVGGKRWQISHVRPLWENSSGRRLVEPFCGGLAVTLGLLPDRALANDANSHLINFYLWLQKGFKIDIPMKNDRELYYEYRTRFNELLENGNSMSQEAASLFYYLNRTGYNGLCRFNSAGFFNVPFGRYGRISYENDFSKYKKIFKKWRFMDCDVEGVPIEPTDFVYADPPYDVEFTNYAKDGFSWEDQKRTAALLAEHPGPVILVNQATKRIEDLYLYHGYDINFLDGPRRISCDGNREPAREIIATRNIEIERKMQRRSLRTRRQLGVAVMANSLKPMQERFFQFLTEHRVGDIVSMAEISAETGWTPATIKTYISKHYMDPFLSEESAGRYQVLRDGLSISKGELTDAFTQKRPGMLVLADGLELQGQNDRYELVNEIGCGATAHVWSARTARNEKCAVKVIMPREDLLAPERLKNVIARFRRESRHGRELRNDHVVRHLDFGSIKTRPFLVMDLADETLALMLESGPLDLQESLNVMTDCLSGLAYLHGGGHVHRDVKPLNILRFGEKFALGDLGIVRWEDMNKEFTSAGTITRASVQLGSWDYMAPEQRRSPHDVGVKGDVYSLGATWYEMLTGRPPDPAEAGAGEVATIGNPLADRIIQRMLSFRTDARPELDEVAQTVRALRKYESGGN